jgi:hypothetical protein
MVPNIRQFEAGPDPFGQMWNVEFRWIQNAITIRHADAVDVKFMLRNRDTTIEKVIELRHLDLLALSAKTGQPLTDPWCMRLAGLHLKKLIETGDDLDRTLITAELDDLTEYASVLSRGAAVRR